MKCQIMLNRFWMTLAESWHIDRPAIPPIVSNIKSKSYLNRFQECHMESHQVKEWPHLIFPSEYPSALPRSGAQRTRNLPASKDTCTKRCSIDLSFFSQVSVHMLGLGGLSLQSIRQLPSLERAASFTSPWQRSAGQSSCDCS